MNKDIDKLSIIVSADLAGLDIQGGTDMTEAERREVYNEYRYIIWDASCIVDYFKSYIEEDKAKCVDQVV